MSNFHSTYSSRAAAGTFAGIDITQGIADGVYFNVAQNTARITPRKGLDGRTSVSLSSDHSAIITVTMFPEANNAKILTGLYYALKQAEMNSLATLGAAPLEFSDPSGAMLLVANEAVLQNVGDISLGEDTGSVTFEFYVPEVTFATAVPDEIAQGILAAKADLGVV